MKKINYFLFTFLSFIIFGCSVYAMPVLESLDIENATIENGFDSEKYEYNIFIDSDSVNLNIDYSVKLENYYIIGIGNQTLQVDTKHYISLIDSDGNLAIYTLNVLRKLPFLKNISFQELDLEFYKNVFSYDLEVDGTIKNLTPLVELENNTEYEIIGSTNLHLGLNKIIIRVKDTSSNLYQDYVFNVNRIVKKDFSSVGSHEYIIPEDGNYEIELWGAGPENAGGAYTKGIINLKAGEKLYFYIGEQGDWCSVTPCGEGGYNGGGNSGYYRGAGNTSGSGATDVRLVSGEWNNLESLKSRIMVAGGGGSSGTSSGNAGGLIGYQNYNSGYVGYGGYGGTQISGGSKASTWSGAGTPTSGGFGFGGNGSRSGSNGFGGGGGGGYYGGGGGSGATSGAWGGGGGSSFISGHAGAIAINEDGTPKVNNYTKIEDSYHYSGKYFTDTLMIDGRGYKWTTSVGSSLAMPNPNGGNFPQGHGNESNGYAKIKYAASHDATGLSNLKISAGTLTPNFESGVYEYNLQLSTKEEEITITAEAIEEWSNILGTGTFLVPSGDSSYTISVVNYDGTIINYVINVNRPTSSYKFLDGIKINGIVYEDFKSNVYEYDIELDTGIDNINLEAIRHITGQTVSGEGNFKFDTNEKTLTLLAKSEDNTQNQFYTFNFKRKKTSELKLISTSVPLNFTSNKYNYEVEIFNSVFTLNFATETYFPDTIVTILGNKYLGEQENIITITSHLDGVDDTIYNIKVKKKENTKEEIGMGFTGSVQEYIVPVSGYYEIELWGAGQTSVGGAYTKGKIKLLAGEKLYFQVGEQGKECPDKACSGGYNGGGASGNYNGSGSQSGSGATDVRLVDGDWNNVDSLKSRIMVAGGSGEYGTVSSGQAGGLLGYQNYNSGYAGYGGYGGTQISGGSRASTWSGTVAATSGGFGYGGNGGRSKVNGFGGGGGGGYYGGGGGSGANTGAWGGGGGSSFISGHAGTIAINEDGKPKVNSYSMIEDSYHYSGKYFTDTLMIDGRGYKWSTKADAITPMPSPSGGYYSTGVGNEGNGAAKITLLSVLSDNNFLDSITLDAGDVAIPFETTKEDYEINLDETHLTLKVDAVPKDKEALVTGIEDIPLPPGKTIHEISVTATDGSVRVYTLTINREPSSNPNPKSIDINNIYDYLCDLNDIYCNYTFDKDITNYDIKYPYDTDNITFVVNKLTPYQDVKIYKDNLDTPLEGFKVNLEHGINTFLIEMISEDKQSKVFTYNIDRDITGNNLLESLKITDPVVDLEFQKYTYEYYVTVPKTVDKYEVEAIPEDKNPNVKVSIKGNTDLQPGMNDCIITVTAQNGDTRTYIIHAYKEVNRSTLLTDLKVMNGTEELTLEPTFSPYLNNYTLNVLNSVSEVNILTTLEDNTASITGNGVQVLKTGVNEIDVIITALNGDVNIYKLVINREKSNNAYLKSLEVTGHPLNINFNKETFEYEINIDREVSSLNVIAEPEDSNATYTIRGNYNLDKVVNEIIITVTAENKEYKVYKIKAYKTMSDNNYLSSLKVMNGTNELALDPEFDKTKNEYHVTVDGSVTNVDVVAVLEEQVSSIKGVGKHYIVAGDNEIEITVTSEDGNDRVYKIIITKELNNDLSLKNIENNRGSEVTKIDDTSLGYDYLINVQYEVNTIDIIGIVSASTSKVQGNGTYNLKTGNNDITLTVVSEAGNRKDYIIRVVRDKSDNDDLSFLFVEEGGIDPHFNETIILYDAKVPNNINTLHIEAITEDKNATYEVIGGLKDTNGNYTYDISNFVVDEPQFVEVIVTAENGIDKKTYTLSVTKQQTTTDNLALEELITNRGELTPIFNPDTLNYELTVENDITDITISAKAFNENTQVIGEGTYNLKVGKNGIAVFVIGESGVQKDYQIVVTRKKSNDATLASLVVKSHTLSPKFNSNTDTYSLNTSKELLEFTTIKTSEEEATYEIIGNKDFVTGENIVTIRVTAPDGETTKDYILNVNKEASKNNNLTSLRVVDYELTPVFHKGVIFYAVDVDNNLNSIVIEATPEDNASTITGTGRHNLKAGENYFDIVVTSEAGATKTYTILVTKEASDNNYLASLSTSDGYLNPNFDKLINQYEVVVPNEITSIEIFGTLEDATASVKGFDTYNLNVGENTIEILVTSESGKTNIYEIKIIRESIISPLLVNLEVENYSLDPEFNKEIFEYFITVDNEVTSLNLTYIPEDENATITVTGNENFVVGMNEVLIKVTASDNTEQEYILYVNRSMSTNNFLKTLSTDVGILDPNFNPNTLEYNISVESDVDVIRVYASTMDSSAVITSKIGNDNPYTLEKGLNKIQIKVRSSIGVTRTYTLNVNRKMSSNNNLLNIEVYAGANKELQELSFQKDILEYEINLNSPYDFVDIVVKKEDSLSSVIGDGIVLLQSGENNLEVIVTSEDGNVNTYKLKINNPKSNNNYLVKLNPSVGELNPSFDKETLSYTLELTDEDSTLSFEAKVENNKATVSGHEIKGVPEGTSIRVITVTAEDGSTREYIINITRPSKSEARLESLEIEGYLVEFDPDTYSYNLSVSISKKELLESEIKAIPKDPEATVNLMGDLTINEGMINIYVIEVIAKDGYTTETYTLNITRDSAEHSLRSNKYEIVRNEEEDYVIGIQPSTIISDFKNNFENNPEDLKVYLETDEVNDTELTATALVLKLEKNGYIYDTLRVIVRGDLTKDGKVNITDQVKMINFVGRTTTFDKYQMLAGDLTFDGKVNITDQVKIINYVGRTISDINTKPTS
jgi:hypothetical protein